jgi:ubiquinone/menaquinone biosynthesis C-methylase UbiE
MESLLELPVLFYSTARSAHFSLQFDVLNGLSRHLPGWMGGTTPTQNDSLPPQSQVREDLIALLRQDSRNIAQGLYPVTVLKPESPLEHLMRIPRLMADGISIYSRRKRGRTTEFSSAAKERLEGLPRYYQRCFHFQTDGYLSERSASLYEHQVEMLFRGSADAMRRLILPPMRRHFAGNRTGRSLRILEIAAGTGPATRFVHLAFPKARIVASDLSSVYLDQARKRMPSNLQIDYLQADGGALPFADQQFDAVYSVFLFHELPLDARKEVLAEARRVLKPGGFFGLVDSIQNGDKAAFDPLLAQFPVDYHEPFFRDYAARPMEGLVSEEGFTDVSKDTGFFSKVVSARKS